METVDMLFTGSHKLTAAEHHAVAKARRKRIRLGREAARVRKQMADSLGKPLNTEYKEGGTVWE